MEDFQQLQFGKTSPEHLVPTEARTSELFSKKCAELKTVVPQFLDLRAGGVAAFGLTQEAFWQTGIPSLGESSTLNFGAYPNGVEESFLSQILQVRVPKKYYLSATACRGVLRRAAKRGKELPAILKEALERQAGGGRMFLNERRTASYDECRDVAPTCVAKYGTGGGNQPIVIENHAQDSRVKICEDGKVPTLNQQMGTGGNNVPLVMKLRAGCEGGGAREREIIGERITYCTSHGSFHTKAEEEGADTIQATDYKDPPIVNDMVETQYIVRRLTPTECGRLQGMPDWWCSDVEHSDAAEYKMWGNGMALPNILYVVENTVRVLQKRRRRAE